MLFRQCIHRYRFGISPDEVICARPLRGVFVPAFACRRRLLFTVPGVPMLPRADVKRRRRAGISFGASRHRSEVRYLIEDGGFRSGPIARPPRRQREPEVFVIFDARISHTLT